MRWQLLSTNLVAAVVVALVAVLGLAVGRWSAGVIPSAEIGASSNVPIGARRLPAPSAEEETGIASTQWKPPSPVASPPLLSRSPSRNPLGGARPKRLQLVQPRPGDRPALRAPGSEEFRVSGDVEPQSAPAKDRESVGSTWSADTRASGATITAPRPPQTDLAALPQPEAPESGVAPPAAGPLPPRQPAPVLVPPVPVSLAPPRQPLPYRMVVEEAGLTATARLEAVAASVRLRVVVRTNGEAGPVEIAVPSGYSQLDAAALEAARHWRFLSARRDGEPIESVVLIWVSFIAEP